MLTVNEIFHSIQGESTRAGEPCVFVRLTACDLRCSWCDTPYAFHEGRKMSIDDIMTAVEKHGCRLVEITGGEPLLQEDVYPLMDRLLAAGRTVMLETGGHRSIDRVPTAVRKIVDVKCPGSGGSPCAEEADRGGPEGSRCPAIALHARPPAFLRPTYPRATRSSFRSRSAGRKCSRRAISSSA